MQASRTLGDISMPDPSDPPDEKNLLDYLHTLETEVGRLTATEAQLLEALKTRETIGIAVGLLMERQKCGHEQAFELIRRGSQHLNIKLRDIAAELVNQFEERYAME